MRLSHHLREEAVVEHNLEEECQHCDDDGHPRLQLAAEGLVPHQLCHWPRAAAAEPQHHETVAVRRSIDRHGLWLVCAGRSVVLCNGLERNLGRLIDATDSEVAADGGPQRKVVNALLIVTKSFPSLLTAYAWG